MRVALVCPYSCTVPGGVQAQVLGLARALEAVGDEVVVVAPADEPAGAVAPAELGGARFIAVGHSLPVPVNGSRAPVAPWPTTMARTARALRSVAPDIVHVHEPLVPGAALAALALGPRPVVATFHRSGLDAAYRAYGRVVGPLADRLAATFAVSAEAAATARTALRRHAGALEIVPNGVELERFADVEPVVSTAPTVVFVGRHEQRKGLAVLLEAARRLAPDVELWVLGDGPDSEHLRRSAPAGRPIVWLGRVDDATRAARVAGADLYVAPSLGGESFGVVLLEAMAASTAVVASDLPGYRLAAGDAAAFVAPGDPGELAATITRLLADDGARRRLVEAGTRRAAEHSMAAVAARYRAAYGVAGGGGAK